MSRFQSFRTKVRTRRTFTYLKEPWIYLTNYKDSRLKVSNNWTKRSIIKPFVIDRKNLLFANTPKRATSNAVIPDQIQTAIKMGIVLVTAEDLTATEVIKKLLPWSAPR